MKPNILKLTAILLISAGSFSSCSKKGDSEPMEIPFKEYSLAGTGCWWINIEPDEVIVINNNKELEKYIACSDDVDYPIVNFSKHTLLLTGGITSCCGVWNIDSFFSKNRKKEYTLKVTIHLTITAFAEPWTIAVFTSKISDDTNIVLNVEEIY